MKRSKDPFEAAYKYSEEEEEEDDDDDEPSSPPDSPTAPTAATTSTDYETPQPAAAPTASRRSIYEDDDYDDLGDEGGPSSGPPLAIAASGSGKSGVKGKGVVVNVGNNNNNNNNNNKEEEYDEEEDNVDVELSKLPSGNDPSKFEKMRAILSRFTEDQMSRYESFRRSAFQKSNMRRLLVSITGSQKISLPMTIVGCGIAKMFVGELVETARIVMTERRESGPIRPCHIREAYRRLKREGKVPRRSVPRLFR